MLSVEEAFEQVADKLTPTEEQLREVEQLRQVLLRHFDDMKGDLQAIEPLSVMVMGGAARPLFAFVLRSGDVDAVFQKQIQLEKRLRRGARGGFLVDGSAVMFDLVSGVLAPRSSRPLETLPLRRDLVRLADTLPSLMEAAVGADAARLGRVVLRSWGGPLEARVVGAVAEAVVSIASGPRVDMATALREVLATVAAQDRRAVRADYALQLTRAGRLADAHAQWRALMGKIWPLDESATASLGDVVTTIGVRGARSIEAAQIELRGLTVLIGENGSGKSTLIEACELLRRMASPAFLDEVNSIHGGLRVLLRHGSGELVLAVGVSGPDLPLWYEVHLSPQGGGASISQERLVIGRADDSGPSIPVIARDRTRASVLVRDGVSPSALPQLPDGLTLTSFGTNPPHPAIGRMVAALKAIEVHVPFEVTPAWVGRAHGRQSVLRGSSMIQSATALERLGVNLANAYHALRSDGSEAHWRETMDYVRLGLGERIESVNTRADVAGGAIALWVKLRGRDEQIPAASLSEGTLAYLAFVALFRLPSKRSLLVFDEPELHLHPRLLARVMGFFHGLAERSPVVLATHSRRLLDELHDPAASAVLCELDDADTTRLRYPDRAALDEWLVDYEGLGRVLDAGYEAEVMVRREGA